MPCVAISCRPDWWNVQYKINKKGDCIINCSSTINRYEYNGKCYDMCDSNCKTCYFEDNISISSNCSSCYENKFLKNGKCVDTCENGYKYYNSNNKINYCTLNYTCPKEFNKLIPEKYQCIDDCTKDSDYPYEFRHTCFHECPNNISMKSKIKEFYCEIKCPLENPFEMIETQNCVKIVLYLKGKEVYVKLISYQKVKIIRKLRKKLLKA